MKELVIKFLEFLLQKLAEKKTQEVSEELKQKAMSFVDKAADQAILDLKRVFGTSKIVKDIQLVTTEMDKILPYAKLAPKEVTDIFKLTEDVCQAFKGLETTIDTDIETERWRLKEVIKNAQSEAVIHEVMNFANSVLSGRVSAIAETFMGGNINVDI